MNKGFQFFIGLIGTLLILVFVLTRLFYEPGEQANIMLNQKYTLFLRLMNKLGYHGKTSFNAAIQTNAVHLYFDFDPEIQSTSKISNFVYHGGTVFILGVVGSKDPFTGGAHVFSRLKTFKLPSALQKESKNNWKAYSVIRPKKIVNKIMYNNDGALIYGMHMGKGTLFMLSDDDFIGNPSIVSTDAAIVINYILARYYKQKFIYHLAGAPEKSAKNFYRALFDKNVLFISVYVIALFLLFFWTFGSRTGQVHLYRKRKLYSTRQHLQGVAAFFEKTHSLKVLSEINEKYFLERVKQYHKSIPVTLNDKPAEDMETLMKKETERDRLLNEKGVKHKKFIEKI